LLAPQEEQAKNIGAIEVRALIRQGLWMPTSRPEEMAKQALESIRVRGRYWPEEST